MIAMISDELMGDVMLSPLYKNNWFKATPNRPHIKNLTLSCMGIMYFSFEENASIIKKARAATTMRVNTMLFDPNSEGMTIFAIEKFILEKQVAINKSRCAEKTERIMMQISLFKH